MGLLNSAQVAVAWRAANLEDVSQRVFGFLSPELRSDLVALLLDCAREQKRLLIDGLTTSGCPPPPGLPMPLCAGALTGIAYIKGSECLSDFGCLAAQELGGGPPRARPPEAQRLLGVEARPRPAPAGLVPGAPPAPAAADERGLRGARGPLRGARGAGE